MGEFTMPSLGADMDEGTLLEWLVEPGEPVRKGDPVAVVETAKSTIEVECFESGTMTELLVEPGATVPVGTPLAVIGPEGRSAPESPARRPVRSTRTKSDRPEPPVPATAESVGEAGDEHDLAATTRVVTEAGGGADARAAAAAEADAEAESEGESEAGPVVVTASAPLPEGSSQERPSQAHAEAGPLARHLAQRSGVDLRTLRGSGPGGRVTRADVEKAAARGGTPARVRITPLARRLAAELGVDLGTVTATGRNSAVRAADVRRAAPGPTAPTRSTPADVRPPTVGPAAPAQSAVPAASAGPGVTMRRAIADLMSRANREIPHYHLSTTVDLAAAMDWLHEHNRRTPVGERLLPAALLLKATALAARDVPELNGFWVDDRFTPGEGVHLAVAVSLRGGGLLAPTLSDADTLALPNLMASLKDLVKRARTGRLRGSEVSGATLTVTNLGDQGVESVFGVIHPPQVALVGFGRIADQPRAVDGLLGVRPVVTATLSADHRATDGAVGARYLTTVTRLLQNPEQL
ncbi:2-oxo acid dehydrogenase subunit E2 [Streptomyces sp. 11x1]|uniref:2-oxo acid dehydrogenase subunit E2 n=1 Tax=Streptomyces sp. 11x1 TaxID=3038642 RepID=UPI002931ACEE|nr:2-oxo acid dehydrogenase subunit E2 [Streptomyces sp. 11x1]WNZ06592.1 2-oxo acid dehydrogenase subunit E2 [Streptomyces sp. 11x1]